MGFDSFVCKNVWRSTFLGGTFFIELKLLRVKKLQGLKFFWVNIFKNHHFWGRHFWGSNFLGFLGLAFIRVKVKEIVIKKFSGLHFLVLKFIRVKQIYLGGTIFRYKTFIGGQKFLGIKFFRSQIILKVSIYKGFTF